MRRRPPISNRTDTLFPYPTLCRSLVALVCRYREIQLQKERRLRIKIADDLHDEVGSSLTRIWHQASQSIPVMEQRKPLRAISETSREAIATMSDIVWSIDARFDTLRDLIMRIKEDRKSTRLNSSH